MHLNRKKKLFAHTQKNIHCILTDTKRMRTIVDFFLFLLLLLFCFPFLFLCFFVLLLKMCTSAEQLILQTLAEQGELTNWNKTKRNEVARGAERKEKNKKIDFLTYISWMYDYDCDNGRYGTVSSSAVVE